MIKPFGSNTAHGDQPIFWIDGNTTGFSAFSFHKRGNTPILSLKLKKGARGQKIPYILYMCIVFDFVAEKSLANINRRNNNKHDRSRNPLNCKRKEKTNVHYYRAPVVRSGSFRTFKQQFSLSPNV